MEMTNRIIDANTNRAAEGMRVLEDIARFILDRSDLCEAIKRCRHNLRHTLATRDAIYARNTHGDVGTSLSTENELERSQLRDVAIAAGNRCAEALRVLEEMLKLDGIDCDVESIRYEMYDHTAAVVKLLGATTRKQWRLCFILTTETCVLPWKNTLQLALDAGCDCVQVREKTMTTRQLVAHTNEVVSIVGGERATVIVNDRVDVAMASGAGGVHLGSSDMTVTDVRQLCGSLMLIGATVHTVEDAGVAIEQGADYIGIGPVFASTTKPDLSTSGVGLLEQVLSKYASVHHVAIGGISPSNAKQIFATRCKGVAMCNAIASSTSPDKVVEKILSGLLQLS